MKEATGDLNVTVIVVISVGVLSAFFFTVLWPMLNNNFKSNARCSDAICVCDDPRECRESGSVECYLKDDKNETFLCDYKG